MRPKTPEGEISPESKKPFKTNNFFLYFSESEQYKGSEEDARVRRAIDKLLAGEFKNLDVHRIYQDIDAANAAMEEALNSGRYDELQKVIKPKLESGRKAEEELRPLFNKLVEMGFDPELLAQ